MRRRRRAFRTKLAQRGLAHFFEFDCWRSRASLLDKAFRYFR